MTIHDLPIKKGITLNLMQINCLRIVMANSIEELTEVMISICNFSRNDIGRILCEKDFVYMKELAFNIYKASMLSIFQVRFTEYGYLLKRDYLIEHISKYLELSETEKEILYQAYEETAKYKILNYIRKKLPNKYYDILEFIDNFDLIECDGLKLTTYDAFIKLSKYIEQYDIINLDNVIKYSSYVKLNGRYNHQRFDVALDFVRRMGKKARLNACLFYMDTPEWVTTLNNGAKSKSIVYNTLSLYINDITQHIKEYENKYQINIVETIEVLNEPLINNGQYKYGRDFVTRKYEYEHSLNKKSKLKDPNFNPGWLRFLEIEDICKLCTIVRHNLPHVKIMCNEYKLENRNKAKDFLKYIIEPMLEYEQKNNIKILDVIGTQCHCSLHTIACDFEAMFENLSIVHLPIEITEFDLYLSPDMFDCSSRKDLHMYKSLYMDNIYEIIIKFHKKYNIQGFTIWSINDTMNFIVNILNDDIYRKNQKLIKQHLRTEKYIGTVFGGYYDANMNERLQCPKYRYD